MLLTSCGIRLLSLQKSLYGHGLLSEHNEGHLCRQLSLCVHASSECDVLALHGWKQISECVAERSLSRTLNRQIPELEALAKFSSLALIHGQGTVQRRQLLWAFLKVALLALSSQRFPFCIVNRLSLPVHALSLSILLD